MNTYLLVLLKFNLFKIYFLNFNSMSSTILTKKRKLGENEKVQEFKEIKKRKLLN